jgi:membrane associated rhomboid family serine protease
VARRFGPQRFLLYAGVGAAAGAAVHLAFYSSSYAPLVGASAAISALMAGAARFLLVSHAPIWGGVANVLPAPPLSEVVRDRRVLTFVGVWFGINLVFGLTNAGGLAAGAVAWDAHLGGFAAGLLLFGFFDPVKSTGR